MDTRQKRIIIIFVLLFFVISLLLIIFGVINSNRSSTEDKVSITNLSGCSEDMQQAVKDSMQTNLYKTIQFANEYNKKESLPTYTATIRDGSCTQKDVSTSGIDGETTIKESEAIIDIPDAKQSWLVTYHWVPEGQKVTTDLGTIIIPSCLSVDKLIYGDFNCENIMSLQKYGTDKADPILQYMPYTGSGFDLTYNPETREVSAIIIVRASQQDNQNLINNLKAQVEYWFTYRNLDISTYTVVYTVKVTEKDTVIDQEVQHAANAHPHGSSPR